MQSFYLISQSNLGKKNVTWWFQLSSYYTKIQNTNAMNNRLNKTTLLSEDGHYSVWEKQGASEYCSIAQIHPRDAVVLENFEFMSTDHLMQNLWDYFWHIWITNISLCKLYVVCREKITYFYQFTKILTSSKSIPCEMTIFFEHWWAQNFNTSVNCQSIQKIQLAMQWMRVNSMDILVRHKLRIFKRGIMKTTEWFCVLSGFTVSTECLLLYFFNRLFMTFYASFTYADSDGQRCSYVEL